MYFFVLYRILNQYEKNIRIQFLRIIYQYIIYFFIRQNNTKYYSSYNQSLNFKLACNKYY